ncbi:hypothetical protein HH308_20710 [Gordonia sp. TBRC 11910]|uniref:DRBM domain-containing protein n=1 Tax=Gordonia asplenii TaxID=2725283 RepID=A0A848L4Z5_9ACTN|nr:putative dsRNA-binding protein [Gordonia asplenii]NMO03641.1 hypothetical protein [Gordonia asplenii]
MPQLPDALADDLETLQVKPDDAALRWVRWARLHQSYLYESVPQPPITSGVLDLLATLGRGWMRVALLDRVRSQRGEFTSNNDVSATLQGDRDARSALAAWVTANQLSLYGTGEAATLAAGGRSSAPEKVAMQILGALSLITGSQAPADRLLDHIKYTPSVPEPDWMTLLTSHVASAPTFSRTDTGPDHDKQFTVTVTVDGLSASGTARSGKAARKLAARTYLHSYAPDCVPAPPSRVPEVRPQLYSAKLPRHEDAREWAAGAFEVADVGLMAQALTHRSWVYENQTLVARAHQRDYGVLATEGAEVLSNLVSHHYVLHTLDESYEVPTTAVTTPSLPRNAIIELFNEMPLNAGILHSRGMRISADVKEDVTQSVVAAAWRANGDLLMERQPSVLWKWVSSFTPTVDPTTLLVQYCGPLKVPFEVDFESRGEHHDRSYRATLTFGIEDRPKWRGGWASTQTAAKHSTAADALSYMLGTDTTQSANSDQDGQLLLRAMLRAELRSADVHAPNSAKDIAVGRLAVDRLAAGDFSGYQQWARVRSQLLPPAHSAVVARLVDYYTAVLRFQRRTAVRHWLYENLPTAGISEGDTDERIATWRGSAASGRLVLLEDLMASFRAIDLNGAVYDFVERQAGVVAIEAGLSLESIRDAESGDPTLILRLSGGELADALVPVVAVVNDLLGTATWMRGPQSISCAISILPTATDPISQAGFTAVDQASRDRWLEQVRSALETFLLTVELAADDSSADRDDLVAAERQLLDLLQAKGEQ